jgi:hypothetical protein
MNENIKEQPSYYAILTADVRYSKELNFFEKVLYADITALTNKNGYCTASNGYFSELFDKTKGTVSKAISKFEKLGFLKVIITRDNNTKQIVDRKLYLLTKITIPMVDNNHTPLVKNHNTPMVENHQENSTSNNTTSINIKNKQKDEVLPENLNIEAFNSWCEYKGKSYSKQGRTLTINKLIQYPKAEQLLMVENSIMNNYKGLFEIKQTSKQVSTQTRPQQNQKSIAEVLIEYVQDRQKGFNQEIATLQAKEKLNWGMHKDLEKVIQDKEYDWYMQNRVAKKQEQPVMNDEEYQAKLLKELYDEN